MCVYKSRCIRMHKVLSNVDNSGIQSNINVSRRIFGIFGVDNLYLM